MARCPECKGKKIIELFGGVIVRRCPECKGKGEIDELTGGIESYNQPVRSTTTRKPRKKRKARKVATA